MDEIQTELLANTSFDVKCSFPDFRFEHQGIEGHEIELLSTKAASLMRWTEPASRQLTLLLVSACCALPVQSTVCTVLTILYLEVT